MIESLGLKIARWAEPPVVSGVSAVSGSRSSTSQTNWSARRPAMMPSHGRIVRSSST
jgi:hypothetical protein